MRLPHNQFEVRDLFDDVIDDGLLLAERLEINLHVVQQMHDGIRLGLHTSSAVNVAELAPLVGDAVDAYLQAYVDAAVRAAQFIKKNMWHDGQLLRRWREGEALYHAGLDEYAFLIRGLISLFEADCGNEWLAWALQMTAPSG